MPIVGFLCTASAAQWAQHVAAFRKGLAEAGYKEGQNVAIEFRWAEGQYDRLPKLAAELVRRKVSVLVAAGGSISALAVKEATSTVPVVFTLGSDPVELGLAASLNRPGGNMTGVSIRSVELEMKLLSVLHELVPQATVAGILVNPGNAPAAQGYVRAAPAASRTLGMELHVLNAGTDVEIDAAFATLAKLRAGALLVGADPFFETRRSRLIALAAREAMPTLYFAREYAVAGGLASYGADIDDAYRQAGIYAGKILSGARPADMPIVQSTKVELVINLKTAKALGLVVPQSLRLRADELIQ
jgi:putative ABC transport system substrate-binding protein